MNKLAIFVLTLLLAADVRAAEPQNSKPHASREAAIQFLRQEGILNGKTQVVDATWSDTFWIVSLRHPDGKVTNWTVDAAAKDYTCICQH